MEGKTLAQFRIIEKLGEGGMGVVYKAEDLKLGRPVALKVLRARFMGDEERVRRFVQEARTAAALSHPNIATIHQIDEWDGITFIAMEYLEGETLRSRIRRERLSLGEAIRVAAEIAAGLAKAHASRVIHRDLKPDNVMVTPEGQVKILDFGLAKLLEVESGVDPGLSQAATTPQGLTQEGKVFGTVAYMSPEQARGKPLDPRSDIFSFGILFYELVTGRVPFEGETPSDTITAILRDPAVPALEINPEVPPELDRILGKCLQKNADDRYQSTNDLLVDVRHLLRDSDGWTTSVTGVSTRTSDRTPNGAGSGSGSHGSAGSGASPSYASPSASYGRPSTGSIPPPSRRGFRVPWVVAIAGMLIVLVTLVVGVLPRLLGPRSPAAPPPATSNTVAVYPFENLKSPGDPERLGQILQELIITDLSEIPQLKVVSSQRLFDLQKTLTGKDDRAFPREVATDVAERAGAASMLTGTLSQLDSKWILTCQLVDVASGTIQSSKSIDGADLYAMVDELTQAVRGDMRVAVSTDGDGQAAGEKTRTSLEAYQHYLTGVDHLNQQRFAEAAQEFEAAVSVDPRFGRAYYELAIASWWAGDFSLPAQEPLRKLLSPELDASPMERQMAEATLALVDQQFEDAVGQFEKLVEMYPDEKDAWYSLGEAYFHGPDARQTDALNAFVHAVRLDPRFFLAYRHMFDIYWQRGMDGEAVDLARLLIELEPTNTLRHKQLITALARQGDEVALDVAMNDAMKVFPDEITRSGLLATVGNARLERGDPAGGEAALQEALRLSSKEPPQEAIEGMVLCRVQQRDYAGAEEWNRRWKDMKPSASPFTSPMTNVYVSEGRVRDGLAIADEVEAARPGSPVASLLRAHFLTYYGDTARVQAVISDAQTNLHGVSLRRQLYHMVGWGYFLTGNYDQANAMFRRVTDEKLGAVADTYVGLGWSALRLLDHANAERWLMKGQSLSSDGGNTAAAMVQFFIEEGRFDEAIAEARRMIRRRSGVPDGYVALIAALLEAGRPDEAGAVLDTARVACPSAASQRWILVGTQGAHPMGAAWSYLRAGDRTTAHDLVREARALPGADRDAGLWQAEGWLALEAGRHTDAERAFREALQVAPPASLVASTARLGLASAALVAGRPRDAERHADEVLREGPVLGHAHRIMAYALAAQGKTAEAAAAAERAFRWDPGRVNQALLAWVLVSGDLDVERGMDLAQTAGQIKCAFTDLGEDLAYVAPLDHTLGVGAMKQGRWADAVAHLESALAVSPRRASIGRDLEEARRKLATAAG